MRIAVFGTGSVGRTVAHALGELGHDVVVGTRDVEATLARTEPESSSNPPFTAWHHNHPAIKVEAYSEAAADADLVVNATSGSGSLSALKAAGADNLADTVLLDIANPLESSEGMPPSLFVLNTDSLGEQIQRAFPATKVVKALNTMSAHLMVDPRQLGDGHHTSFVSGNDDAAKRVVIELLSTLGHRDVIDLGDITTARGTEMYLPLWLRLWGALGTPTFSIKVVR